MRLADNHCPGYPGNGPIDDCRDTKAPIDKAGTRTSGRRPEKLRRAIYTDHRPWT